MVQGSVGRPPGPSWVDRRSPWFRVQSPQERRLSARTCVSFRHPTVWVIISRSSRKCNRIFPACLWNTMWKSGGFPVEGLWIGCGKHVFQDTFCEKTHIQRQKPALFAAFFQTSCRGRGVPGRGSNPKLRSLISRLPFPGKCLKMPVRRVSCSAENNSGISGGFFQKFLKFALFRATRILTK